MEQQSKECLRRLLADHVDFLRDYFFVRALKASSTRLQETSRLIVRKSLPLLDYLYDKQLQIDCNVLQVIGRVLLAAEQKDQEDETLLDHTSRLDSLVITETSTAEDHLLDQDLCNLRTLYRFRVDNLLEDHSSHYSQSFLPFYRFSRHRNFSAAVGCTMKRNIRGLYDLIRSRLKRDDVCPCIIIYNLFVRDNFRLFSLVSMQHCNYVRVYDDLDHTETIVTYVELSNAFPQISQWFPNINGQYVKKYGPHTLQKLHSYVTLVDQHYRSLLPLSTPSPSSSSSSSSSTTTTLPIAKRFSHKNSSSNRKNKRTGCTPTTTAAATKKKKRTRIESLFPTFEQSDFLLDRLFRSGYTECKHTDIERFYMQLRSGDESATLIVRCNECGKQLSNG